MATLEPEREMKEESTAPYSSPPDPATLDVLSDQFMDFPEAPDANPPSSENIFPILFSPPCSPLMPPGPVCYVSPAHISPTLSQSLSPMSALVHEYNPLPPNPNLSADEALQRIIKQIETPGNTSAAEEHPVITRICVRIHEQEGHSFLDRMLLTTSHLVHLSGLNLETCYALPAQEGVDEFGTPYQDYLILHACMVVVGEESIANPTGRITQFGTAYIQFYPHPPFLTMNLGFPAATSNNPDPPSSPPADLPTCNGSSPPSVPDPLSSHPIAPSSPPPVPTSAPTNEPPSLDQALHVVARHIEAVGDNVVEPPHPAIAYLCAQIREEERHSMLNLLIYLHAHLDNSDAEEPAAPAPEPPVSSSDDDPPPSYSADSVPAPAANPTLPIIVFTLEEEEQTTLLLTHDHPISGLQLLVAAVDQVTEDTHPTPSPAVCYGCPTLFLLRFPSWTSPFSEQPHCCTTHVSLLSVLAVPTYAYQCLPVFGCASGSQ